MSQAVQFLSKSWPGPAFATSTGLLQVRPPLVDRLTITFGTMGPLGESSSGMLEISHTLCAASKATLGSLTRSKVPPAAVVMPGRFPLV